MSLFRLLLRVVVVAVLTVGAAWSAEPAELTGAREISVGMYLVNISNLDENTNTFTVELDVFLSLNYPELAFDPQEEGRDVRVYTGKAAEELRSEIWSAQIFPANTVGQLNMGGMKIVVAADGHVQMTVRVDGSLRARLDYREFPFDSQRLPIEIESFPWNRDEVTLRALPEHTGFNRQHSLAEWEIAEIAISDYESTRMRDEVPFSTLSFDVVIERNSGFYLLKIFLTIVIIVALTWVVFWMSGEGLGRRAGVSSSGILTVIAYQFVTSASLPKVSYLTVADKVMILSIMTIAATMLESIVVDRWTHTEPERKLKVDRICRVAFPVVYLSLLAILGIRH
ncbi:MAG: hypothetical protein ACI9UK_002595 [Candidatus Krumholzibacteriia bacterium]|jgi:hypothetical protein